LLYEILDKENFTVADITKEVSAQWGLKRTSFSIYKFRGLFDGFIIKNGSKKSQGKRPFIVYKFSQEVINAVKTGKDVPIFVEETKTSNLPKIKHIKKEGVEVIDGLFLDETELEALKSLGAIGRNVEGQTRINFDNIPIEDLADREVFVDKLLDGDVLQELGDNVKKGTIYVLNENLFLEICEIIKSKAFEIRLETAKLQKQVDNYVGRSEELTRLKQKIVDAQETVACNERKLEEAQRVLGEYTKRLEALEADESFFDLERAQRDIEFMKAFQNASPEALEKMSKFL